MSDKQQRAVSKLGYHLSADLGFRLEGIHYLLTRVHVDVLATQEEVGYMTFELEKLRLRVMEKEKKERSTDVGIELGSQR